VALALFKWFGEVLEWRVVDVLVKGDEDNGEFTEKSEETEKDEISLPPKEEKDEKVPGEL